MNSHDSINKRVIEDSQQAIINNSILDYSTDVWKSFDVKNIKSKVRKMIIKNK